MSRVIKQVTVAYVDSKGTVHADLDAAREAQKLLNIRQVFEAHGIHSKQFDALCTCIRDNWTEFAHAVHNEPMVVDTPGNSPFVPQGDCESCGAAPNQLHGPTCTNPFAVRFPMVCMNVGQPEYCNCPACEFNRSIEK